MSKPLVSIIIPTYNRKDMVIRLIKSVLASTYKNIEIIVVDDASVDGTADAVKRTFANNKSIRVVRNKINLFAAGSRNEGTRHSKGEYLFYVDDDNVLDKNAINELVNMFEKDKTTGELGLVNYSFNEKDKILWLCTLRDMLTSKTNLSTSLEDFPKQATWETADVPNAFMIRTILVKRYGISFCEKLGIMYEESDLAYRIRSAGYKIQVVRGAKIYHDIEGSLPGFAHKDYMYHFMNDARRPYVFARNRIIFHSLYSDKLQLLSILFVWIWVFTAYYSYKIIWYSGIGQFSLSKRISLALRYWKGDIDGIFFVLRKEKLSYPQLM